MNEKYKGDALLQKKFTTDFLTKKQKVNEGEVPQYYVENSHPAIIDPLEFDMVQAEMSRRQNLEKKRFGLSGRVKFSNCPSMSGLLLAMSHQSLKGTVGRAIEVERILYYLQTGYNGNPCKGFGG